MVVSVTNGLRPAVGRQEIDCLFSAGPELLGGCVREGRRRRIEGIFMSPFTLVHRVVVPLCSSSSCLSIAPLKLVDSDWSVPHLARPKYFDSDFTFSSDSSSIRVLLLLLLGRPSPNLHYLISRSEMIRSTYDIGIYSFLNVVLHVVNVVPSFRNIIIVYPWSIWRIFVLNCNSFILGTYCSELKQFRAMQ